MAVRIPIHKLNVCGQLLAQEIRPGVHQVIERTGGEGTKCWTESRLRPGYQAWLRLHRSQFGLRCPQVRAWSIGEVADGFHIRYLACLLSVEVLVLVFDVPCKFSAVIFGLDLSTK